MKRPGKRHAGTAVAEASSRSPTAGWETSRARDGVVGGVCFEGGDGPPGTCDAASPVPLNRVGLDDVGAVNLSRDTDAEAPGWA